MHLVHQYPPGYIGGVELYTESLVTQQARQGHHVTVFTRINRAGQGLEESPLANIPNATIYRAWHGEVSPTRRFLISFGDRVLHEQFRQALQKETPDVVHIQHLMGLPLSIVDLMQVHKIPYVVSFHDFWWRCANANLLTNYSQQLCNGPKAYLNCIRCVAARATQKVQLPLLLGAGPIMGGVLAFRNHKLANILHSALGIATPSRFMRAWYQGQGLSNTPIHCIPLPMETWGSAALPTTRPECPRRFLYLGGLAPIKGVHIVVEAFARLDQSLPAELWIAGDANQNPAYTERLKSNADRRIRFLGRLDRLGVETALAECHVVLIPSLCHESFSFVAHEALLANRPVFASDLGALTELIQHEKNGMRLPPGDVNAWHEAIKRVIQEPQWLDEISPAKHGAIPEPWTHERHLSALMALYNADGAV